MEAVAQICLFLLFLWGSVGSERPVQAFRSRDIGKRIGLMPNKAEERWQQHLLAIYNFSNPSDPILKPCQAFMQSFASSVDNFTNCVMQSSLPPRICLSCTKQYLEIEQAYYNLKDNTDVKSEDGKPCSTVVFQTYDDIYAEQIYSALIGQVWYDSDCSECLEFVINPTSDEPHAGKSESGWRLNNKTARFVELFNELHECIEHNERNKTLVCESCWKFYDSVNLYYEKAVMSRTRFCSDILSQINDTIRFWRTDFGCLLPERPTRHSDSILVALISSIFFLTTFMFYLGSFMQGSRRKRNLKKYRGWYSLSFASAITSDNQDESTDDIVECTGINSDTSNLTERSPLLTSRNRNISYSRLPPSNLG